MEEEFFEDSSVSSIAEAHVTGIRNLESSEAKRILKYYQEVRQGLQDRLNSMGQGTFNAQRMRGILTQIDLATEEMTKRLKKNMRDTSKDVSLLGVENLITEINTWDGKFTGAITPINLNALAVATDASNFLFNRYEASMDQYEGLVRYGLAQALQNAVLEGVNLSDVVQKVSQFFLAEEWKIHRLVRTEIHNIYNVGKIKGMMAIQKDSVPDLMKTLYHPMDKRTGEDSKRLAKNNPIVPIDEPFIETSTGKRLEYMNPPNRPNDRSILIPYRSEWGKKRSAFPVGLPFGDENEDLT